MTSSYIAHVMFHFRVYTLIKNFSICSVPVLWFFSYKDYSCIYVRRLLLNFFNQLLFKYGSSYLYIYPLFTFFSHFLHIDCTRLFIYLFILGHARSSWLCVGLSLAAASEAIFPCAVRAPLWAAPLRQNADSRCTGFSSVGTWAQQLRLSDSRAQAH